MQGGFNEIGIPTVEDFNSGSLLGCQYSAATIHPASAKSESSQTSFLDSAVNQRLTNLKVFSLTLAKKIVCKTEYTRSYFLWAIIQSELGHFDPPC